MALCLLDSNSTSFCFTIFFLALFLLFYLSNYLSASSAPFEPSTLKLKLFHFNPSPILRTYIQQVHSAHFCSNSTRLGSAPGRGDILCISCAPKSTHHAHTDARLWLCMVRTDEGEGVRNLRLRRPTSCGVASRIFCGWWSSRADWTCVNTPVGC